MQQTDLYRAITGFRAASRGHADWRSEALKPMGKAFNSVAVTMWLTSGFRLPVFRTYNTGPEFDSDYRVWASIDPNFQFVVRYPFAPVVHDDLVIRDKDKVRHPYYRWQRRYFDLPYRLMGKSAVSRFSQVGVALLRDTPFTDGEIGRFAAVNSRICSALSEAVADDQFELVGSRDEQRRDEEFALARRAVRAWKHGNMTPEEAIAVLKTRTAIAAEMSAKDERFLVAALRGAALGFEGHPAKALKALEQEYDSSPGPLRESPRQAAVRNAVMSAVRARIAHYNRDVGEYLLQARLAWDFSEFAGQKLLRMRVRDLFCHALRMNGLKDFAVAVRTSCFDVEGCVRRESQLERLVWECIEPY